MRSTIFMMITTKKSDHYTDLAIESFFNYTKLKSDDVFYLIDNDGIVTKSRDRVTVIVNQQPQSFSKNINDVINIASGKDIVVLNNDVVFTENWLQPLTQHNNVIVIPSCNQTHEYATDELTLTNSMYLNEFTGYRQLTDIVRRHKQSNPPGFYERQLMPFYVFRLPYNVYSKVGLFDESFGVGGGEDVDYRIRAIELGFNVKYTTQSYLLHFHGKSTWDGGETSTETQQRNQIYFNRFSEKWGSDLANLLLTGGDAMNVVKKYILGNETITNMIKQLIYLRDGHRSIIQLKNVSASGLLPYVRQLGDNLVGCELGVCKAFTLRYFLDLAPEISKVYAIDSWTPYMDWWGPVTQQMVDNWREYAMLLLDPYMDKIELLEMDAISAAKMIDDNSLDYIFIDGDHSYNAVTRDLNNYWSKVKAGGIFAGHDWNLPEVYQAVNEFREQNNITTEIQFTETNVWFWYK